MKFNIELTTIAGEKVELLGPLYDCGHCNVYRVMYNGEPLILKWKENNDFKIDSWYFYKLNNLIKLYKDFDEALCVPIAIVICKNTDEYSNKFGYLMRQIPASYSELINYFKPDILPNAIRFSSYKAQLNTAIMIAAFMRKLHLKGLSMNLDPEDILVNCETGDIKIINSEKIVTDSGAECDSNNLAFNIAYLAPEIHRSDYKLNPSMETDRYSLAVVLYRLFFIDHPMEGKKWENYPLLTLEIEKSLYSVKPVFHLDPNDDSNRPDDCFAPNAKIRWGHEALYTKELRETFIKVFTEGIDEPTKRPSELEWMSVISQARDCLINLDMGRERFVDFDNQLTIPKGCLAMKISNKRVALYPQKEIYEFTLTGDPKQYAKVVGAVAYDKRNDKPVVRNLTDQSWRCYSPQTKQLTDLSKGQEFPLEPGVVIELLMENSKIIGEIFDPLK